MGGRGRGALGRKRRPTGADRCHPAAAALPPHRRTHAPPRQDGAQAVIHAATVPWEAERRINEGTPLLPHADCRYYSRGAFTGPLLCRLDGAPGRSLGSKIAANLWGLSTVLHSLADYPLRKCVLFFRRVWGAWRGRRVFFGGGCRSFRDGGVGGWWPPCVRWHSRLFS